LEGGTASREEALFRNIAAQLPLCHFRWMCGPLALQARGRKGCRLTTEVMDEPPRRVAARWRDGKLDPGKLWNAPPHRCPVGGCCLPRGGAAGSSMVRRGLS